MRVKFIYSEKATKFCKISTVDLSYVVMVKSTVEISQNVVAFSEYMNFTLQISRNSSKSKMYNTKNYTSFKSCTNWESTIVTNVIYPHQKSLF